MQEANKDAAAQCLQRGQRCEQQGDLSGALKWLLKSQNLYPTPACTTCLRRVRDAIDRERREQEQAGSSSPSSSSSSYSSSPSSSHSNSHSQSNTTEDTTETREATEDQTRAVLEVLAAGKRKHGLYHVLSLAPPPAASPPSSAVNKAYKKTAVKVHPDKNPHPRAEEAFKLVSEAFTTLSDDRMRMAYDHTGESAASAGPSHTTHTHRHRNTGELTPEEIYAAFFGASPFLRPHRYGRRVHIHRPTATVRGADWAMLWPFLFIVLMTFMSMSFAPQRDPQFVLERNRVFFPVQRQTSRGATYFVAAGTPTFTTQQERNVENRWVLWKERLCAAEQKEKAHWERVARVATDPDRRRTAESTLAGLGLHSCAALDTFHGRSS